MGQEQPSPERSDQPDLDRTQPSPSRPPRRLDWRPPDYRTVGEAPQEEVPTCSSCAAYDTPSPPTRQPRARLHGWSTRSRWRAGRDRHIWSWLLCSRAVQRKPNPRQRWSFVTPTVTLAPRPLARFHLQPQPRLRSRSRRKPPRPRTVRRDQCGRLRARRCPCWPQLSRNPGVNGALIQVLDSGITLAVIGGPEEADGYTWWQLRTADGNVEGWSALAMAKTSFLRLPRRVMGAARPQTDDALESTMQDSQSRIARLREQINHHAYRYYVLADPSSAMPNTTHWCSS